MIIRDVIITTVLQQAIDKKIDEVNKLEHKVQGIREELKVLIDEYHAHGGVDGYQYTRFYLKRKDLGIK